jgi:hypothetical protein
MTNSPKSWQFNIEESKNFLAKAERLAHFSIEILNENRSIVKVLSELHKSVIHLIKAFLDLEVKNGKIKISDNPKKDIMLFFDKVADKYLEKNQTKTLFLILTLVKKHNDAHLEFVKNEKFVIFSEKDCKVITKQNLKNLILATKEAISKFPIKHKI